MKKLILIVSLSMLISMSCTTLNRKMIDSQLFETPEYPVYFSINNIQIFDENNLLMDTVFIEDSIRNICNKYSLNFTEEDISPYILDLKINENKFYYKLNNVSALSGILTLIRKSDNKLIDQVILTRESTIPIDSSYELYQILDTLFLRLADDISEPEE